MVELRSLNLSIHPSIHVPNSVAVIPPSAARAGPESWNPTGCAGAPRRLGRRGTKEEPRLLGCSPRRRGGRLVPHPGRPDGTGRWRPCPGTRAGPSTRGPDSRGARSASILALGAGATSGAPCHLPSPRPRRTLGAACPLAERRSTAGAARGHFAQSHGIGSERVPTRWRAPSPPAAMTGGGAAPHRTRRGWTCVNPTQLGNAFARLPTSLARGSPCPAARTGPSGSG